MIRTFGLGPRAKKCFFWRFGIGPPAKIVGKSQVKCKNNALGKMAVFGPFFRSMDGHIVPKTEFVFRQYSQCFP